MDTIEQLAGTYEGTGAWYDAAGKTQGYRIVQHNVATDTGFEVRFKHDFDDGSSVEASFSMIWVAPFLFRVDIGGAPVGNGHVFANYCHYHLEAGEAFVEASYRAEDHQLEVFGSSSKNAERLYIAWKETLRRTTAEPA